VLLTIGTIVALLLLPLLWFAPQALGNKPCYRPTIFSILVAGFPTDPALTLHNALMVTSRRIFSEVTDRRCKRRQSAIS
jgi:hypothetical protein